MSSPPSSPRPEDIIRLEDLEKKCPGAPRKKRRSRNKGEAGSSLPSMSRQHYFRPLGDIAAISEAKEEEEDRSPAVDFLGGNATSSRVHRAAVEATGAAEPPKIERVRPVRLFPDDDVLSKRNIGRVSAVRSNAEAGSIRSGAEHDASTGTPRRADIVVAHTAASGTATLATATGTSANTSESTGPQEERGWK